MLIVAGHITVEPHQRDAYIAACVTILEQARATAGCLDSEYDVANVRTLLELRP